MLSESAELIFGGLISATLLDTLLTPLLFLRFGEKPLERLLTLPTHAGDSGRVTPAESF